MSPKYLIGGVFALMLVVLGVALIGVSSGAAPVTEPAAATVPAASAQDSTSTTASAPAETSSGYTMADVAAHSAAASCWSAINGSVYDLTKWISQHPGGPEAILSICGADGSAAFNAQHGGAREPASVLRSYYIGPLK